MFNSDAEKDAREAFDELRENDVHKKKEQEASHEVSAPRDKEMKKLLRDLRSNATPTVDEPEPQNAPTAHEDLTPDALASRLADLEAVLAAAYRVDWNEPFRHAQAERSLDYLPYHKNLGHSGRVTEIRKATEMYEAKVKELRENKLEHQEATKELQESIDALTAYVVRQNAGTQEPDTDAEANGDMISEHKKALEDIKSRKEELLRKRDELAVRIAQLKAAKQQRTSTKTDEVPPLDPRSLRLYLPGGKLKIDDSLTIDLTATIGELRKQVKAMRERLRSFWPPLDDLPLNFEVKGKGPGRRGLMIHKTWLKVLVSRYQAKTGIYGEPVESSAGGEKAERKVGMGMELSEEAKERMAKKWNEMFSEKRGYVVPVGETKQRRDKGVQQPPEKIEEEDDYDEMGFLQDEYAPEEELLAAQEEFDKPAQTSSVATQRISTPDDAHKVEDRADSLIRSIQEFGNIHARILDAGSNESLDSRPSPKPKDLAQVDEYLRAWLKKYEDCLLGGYDPEHKIRELLKHIAEQHVSPAKVWAGRLEHIVCTEALPEMDNIIHPQTQSKSDASALVKEKRYVTMWDTGETVSVPASRPPLDSSDFPAWAFHRLQNPSNEPHQTIHQARKTLERNLRVVARGGGDDDDHQAAQYLRDRLKPKRRHAHTEPHDPVPGQKREEGPLPERAQDEAQVQDEAKLDANAKQELRYPRDQNSDTHAEDSAAKPRLRFGIRTVPSKVRYMRARGLGTTQRAYSTSTPAPTNAALADKESALEHEPSDAAPPPASLPHLTPTGSAHMVSISAKSHTPRTAIAVGTVYFSNPTPLSLVTSNSLKKGDVLSVSRVAGIMAAKKCPDIVPLCHPIPLTHVGVELRTFAPPSAPPCPPPSWRSTIDPAPAPARPDNMDFGGVQIECRVACTGATGVEMEALTAVMGTALSVVDMCKAVDKFQRIGDVRVVLKEGGKSGVWREEGWTSWQTSWQTNE